MVIPLEPKPLWSEPKPYQHETLPEWYYLWESYVYDTLADNSSCAVFTPKKVNKKLKEMRSNWIPQEWSTQRDPLFHIFLHYQMMMSAKREKLCQIHDTRRCYGVLLIT